MPPCASVLVKRLLIKIFAQVQRITQFDHSNVNLSSRLQGEWHPSTYSFISSPAVIRVSDQTEVVQQAVPAKQVPLVPSLVRVACLGHLDHGQQTCAVRTLLGVGVLLEHLGHRRKLHLFALFLETDLALLRRRLRHDVRYLANVAERLPGHVFGSADPLLEGLVLVTPILNTATQRVDLLVVSSQGRQALVSLA